MARTFNHRIKYSPGMTNARVGVIMGSISDFPTMVHACDALEQFKILYEVRIISAHRTPDRMMEYAQTAAMRGLNVIIAGAGGAAHLPGMVSGSTRLPVFGVPIQSKALSGWDSLLSITQMPKGVPTPTMSIGESGAFNAGLSAGRVIALYDHDVRLLVEDYILGQTANVPEEPDFEKFKGGV